MECETCMGAHADAAGLAECLEAYLDYEGEMEARAEMAAERYFEDRGWAEAIAEREWEDARGVVQFGDAMRMAEEAAARKA